MDISLLLEQFVLDTKAVLGENLVGVYLHGSLAMGCFHEMKSDVDLIVVVNRPLFAQEKYVYLEKILALNEKAPAKGMELSVVLLRDMKAFRHPAPFDMHFSNAHLNAYKADPEGTLGRLNGSDRDLAAHITIINHFGKTLFGKEKGEVFSAVSHEDYLDALMYDLENAREDIVENPMYVTFSLCRVLAYVKDGKILSKKTGAEWALENGKEEYREPILCAVHAYETETDMSLDADLLKRFADEMLAEIQRELTKKR